MSDTDAYSEESVVEYVVSIINKTLDGRKLFMAKGGCENSAQYRGSVGNVRALESILGFISQRETVSVDTLVEFISKKINECSNKICSGNCQDIDEYFGEAGACSQYSVIISQINEISSKVREANE